MMLGQPKVELMNRVPVWLTANSVSLASWPMRRLSWSSNSFCSNQSSYRREDGRASMALTVMARGITVNAIAPGPVRTAQTTDPNRADAAVALPPMGRLIVPQEIAATVLFLLSDAAGAITGQTLVQCGGLSLAPPSTATPQRGADHETL